MSETTIAELLAARAHDEHIGLRFEDESWTWAEVVRECATRAAWLESLRPDGPFHVGVLLDNVPEYVFLLGGAALAGATVVGINPTRRGEELAADIRHTDCCAIVTEARHLALLDGLDTGVPSARVFDIDGPGWPGTIAAHRARRVPAGAPDGRCALRADLHLRIDGRAQGGARHAGPVRSLRRGDALHVRRRPVLLDAAVPRQRARVELRSGADNRCDDRAAAHVLRVGVPRPTSGASMPRTSTPWAARSRTCSPRPNRRYDREHRVKFALGPESSPADVKAFRERFGIPVVEGYG